MINRHAQLLDGFHVAGLVNGLEFEAMIAIVVEANVRAGDPGAAVHPVTYAGHAAQIIGGCQLDRDGLQIPAVDPRRAAEGSVAGRRHIVNANVERAGHFTIARAVNRGVAQDVNARVGNAEAGVGLHRLIVQLMINHLHARARVRVEGAQADIDPAAVPTVGAVDAAQINAADRRAAIVPEGVEQGVALRGVDVARTILEP